LVWGWPLIAVIMVVGTYLAFTLRIFRFSILKLLFKSITEREDCEGNISVFASLCTALSSTIGTGNIAGISVAIAIGGPGALFWLWISSILSFAIKYAEGLLAIKYRKIDEDGVASGGPMYYIEMGLKKTIFNKYLASSFAILGTVVTLLGTGTFAQSNSIAMAFESFGVPIIASTIIITLLVAIITFGGLRVIAAVSEKLVPIMAVFYVGSALLVFIINFQDIPHVFYLIIKGAFSPESLFGGSIGVSITHAVSVGVRRGIYSHESGLGSSAIASATARTTSPARQGLVSMSGAIFSVFICTMTGLVLLLTYKSTGIFDADCKYTGAILTSYAFGHGLGMVELGKYVVGIGIILFAFTTIIGWNYYGEKCIQYVFGDKSIIIFKVLYIMFVAMGPFLKITTIFTLADTLTGFMAITNLMGIIGLRKVVIEETRKSFV
jgi:AGCS family alanine or glycine:cation symporter